MKATLEFDLDDPDDRMNHLRCIKSSEMALCFWELVHNFWRKWKHDEKSLDLNSMQDEINNLLNKYNIDVDELA